MKVVDLVLEVLVLVLELELEISNFKYCKHIFANICKHFNGVPSAE